jgi:hypothetical protein
MEKFFDDCNTGSSTSTTLWAGENNSTRYVRLINVSTEIFGTQKAIQWTNKGNYGWLYVRNKIAGKRWEEGIWIMFDYYDSSVDANINMIVGLTASWTEAWDRKIFHSAHD